MSGDGKRKRDEKSKKRSRDPRNFVSTDVARAYRINRRGYLQPVNYCWSPKTPDATARRKAEFLKVFAETGSVTIATIAIKSWRSNVYKWRREDPEFAAAWQEIWDATVDELETSMMQRAIHGYEKPVYQQGKLVGSETVHAPHLSMFMLSKIRRDQYGDTIVPSIAPAEYARMVREASRAQDEEASRALQQKKE